MQQRIKIFSNVNYAELCAEVNKYILGKGKVKLYYQIEPRSSGNSTLYTVMVEYDSEYEDYQ